MRPRTAMLAIVLCASAHCRCTGITDRPVELSAPPLTTPASRPAPADRYVSFRQAAEQIAELPPAEQQQRATILYQRYCQNCHGPVDQSQAAAGKTFDLKALEARSRSAGRRADEQLYELVSNGSGAMLALEGTMTPVERVLVIRHLRALAEHRAQSLP